MPSPTLHVSKVAADKLRYLYSRHGVEIGGFGFSESADKPLSIADVLLFPQESTSSSIDFDAGEIDSRFVELAEEGFSFNQFGRVWCHIQPGSSEPSTTDWQHYYDLLGAQQDAIEARARLNPDADIPPIWLIMLVFGTAPNSKPKAIFGCVSPQVGFATYCNMVVEVEEEPRHDAWELEFDRYVTKGAVTTKTTGTTPTGYHPPVGFQGGHNEPSSTSAEYWRKKAQERAAAAARDTRKEAEAADTPVGTALVPVGKARKKDTHDKTKAERKASKERIRHACRVVSPADSNKDNDSDGAILAEVITAQEAEDLLDANHTLIPGGKRRIAAMPDSLKRRVAAVVILEGYDK
jgi:hypothetical protein